jgi:hypothetical protein
MEQTESSTPLADKIQTPGNHPKERIQQGINSNSENFEKKHKSIFEQYQI